ncbi:MAG: FkbM family methyltransferase [Chromatiaceae bacterium]|nr:FkbM family methyltransferase [Chromatiaceae bacterium]
MNNYHLIRFLERTSGRISSVKARLHTALYPKQYFIFPRALLEHHEISFSQEGEDVILSRLFDDKKDPGFYVDVGAHHPQRFSNTYRFYLRGWWGINIDPFPGCMKVFNELRPRDINLEFAISDNDSELTYYEFNESALNTFSESLAQERDGLRSYRLLKRTQIKTRRLSTVLGENINNEQRIDFLSVDAEGLDLNVLRSNNWDRYRPVVVLAEALQAKTLADAADDAVVTYMSDQGYQLISKAVKTLIFWDTR